MQSVMCVNGVVTEPWIHHDDRLCLPPPPISSCAIWYLCCVHHMFFFLNQSIIDMTANLFNLSKASFPGNLHLVLVLRPTSFFHRTVTDIGFRFSQEDFMLKMPVRQLLLSYQTCPTSQQGTPRSCLHPWVECSVEDTAKSTCWFQFKPLKLILW